MSPASSAAAATAPPWADLLPELCGLVTDRLDPISILRFPAVCKGWSKASEENPRLRPGAPALLTSGLDPDGCEIESNVDAGAFGLHDVSAGGGKSFLGEAEGLKGRTWVGGKDGWLVTTDCGCDVELLNPVTGARVRLPSFATIRGVEVPGYLHVRTTGAGHCHKILKVALCRTAAHPDGHLAVALFSEGVLAFTAAAGGGGEGECRWTALKNPADASRSDVSYMDAIVLDGKLFAVNELGRIYSWDLNGGAMSEPAVVQGPEIDEMIRHDHDHDRCGYYLGASDGGGGHHRLLLVYVHGYDVADMYKYRGKCWDSRVWSRLVFDDRRSFLELGMSVHELDGGSGTWRRVTDLGGDRALFLGANYPFYVNVRHGRRGPSEDEADLEADCVYLADTPYGCDAAIFDLKKREGGDGCVKRRLAYSLVADPLQMPMWLLPTEYPH